MEKEKVNQTIETIVDKIVKAYQPEKIILFGSWAWGNPDEDSDIDLLVVKRSPKTRIERERELQSILFSREVALDLLVYTPEELEKNINSDRNLFLEDIVRNGRVLYSKIGFEIRLTHKPAELIPT